MDFLSMKEKTKLINKVKRLIKRAEIYCRAIAHNIVCFLFGLFEQSLKIKNLYK